MRNGKKGDYRSGTRREPREISAETETSVYEGKKYKYIGKKYNKKGKKTVYICIYPKC